MTETIGRRAMPLDFALPVLVVDDEDLTAQLIRAFLAGIGFAEVDIASDGLDAWTMLRHKQYGLVISDYRMRPVNGLLFLRSIREDEVMRNVQFMLITASKDPEIVKNAADLEVDAFLLKPFTMQSLRSAILGMDSRKAA